MVNQFVVTDFVSKQCTFDYSLFCFLFSFLSILCSTLISISLRSRVSIPFLFALGRWFSPLILTSRRLRCERRTAVCIRAGKGKPTSATKGSSLASRNGQRRQQPIHSLLSKDVQSNRSGRWRRFRSQRQQQRHLCCKIHPVLSLYRYAVRA